MELFDVHVLGFEVSEERATRSLMHVFGLNEAAARIFVHSVPRIGKRRVPKETAERYIRALHAVGAIVECRVTLPIAAESANISLPAPQVSKFPGAIPHIMQDSFGVMAPVAYSPHMPEIPKAPRIPADLHAIRARKGPDSLAPHWRPTYSPDSRPGSSPRAPAYSEPDSRSQESAAFSSGREGSPAAVTFAETAHSPLVTAETAEGASFDQDSFLSSPRPSPAPLDPDTPWYAQPTYQLVLACAIIGTMTLAAGTGMFETNASRLGREFDAAGVHAGQYDRAGAFIAAADTKIDGASKGDVRGVLDELLKAGAVDAWAINITREQGARTAHELLVELPPDPSKRKSILAAQARLARPPRAEIADHGQRYITLSFRR